MYQVKFEHWNLCLSYKSISLDCDHKSISILIPCAEFYNQTRKGKNGFAWKKFFFKTYTCYQTSCCQDCHLEETAPISSFLCSFWCCWALKPRLPRPGSPSSKHWNFSHFFLFLSCMQPLKFCLSTGGASDKRAEHVGCVCHDRKLQQIPESESWTSWKEQVSFLISLFQWWIGLLMLPN